MCKYSMALCTNYPWEYTNKGKFAGQGKDIWKIYRIFLLIFVDFFKKMLIIIIRMDIIRVKPMALEEVIQAISGKKVVVGVKQLRKALASGVASRIYLAKDADPAITEPIVTWCKLHNVEVAWVRSMTDLGHACGIEVGAAAAADVNPT